MAGERKYKVLFPFSGGLNTSDDPIVAAQNSWRIARNVQAVTTSDGQKLVWKKRGGQARYNSTAITNTPDVVYGTDYWANVSNSKRQRYVAITANGAGGGKVWASVPGSGTWQDKTGTLSITVALGDVTTEVFNEDLVIGLKGQGRPYKWDNQSSSADIVQFASSTGAPSAWIVGEHKSRLLLAGNPAAPDSLYISAPNAHEDFNATTATTIQISPGDGDPEGITAIFPSIGQGELYVAKRTKIYRIDTSSASADAWSVQPLTEGLGCVGPNAVVAVDQADIAFCSDRGIHTLRQILSGTAVREDQFISASIKKDYDDVLDTSERRKYSMIYDDNLQAILVNVKREGVSTFDTVYGYNYQAGVWYEWRSIQSNFLFQVFDSTEQKFSLFSAGNNGFVNKQKQTDLNDFSAAIVSRLQTQAIAPDVVPLFEKSYTDLGIIYRSKGNYDIRGQITVDGTLQDEVTWQQKLLGSNILGTTVLGPLFVLGNSESIKPNFNHINANTGTYITIDIFQDGENQDLELLGIIIAYDESEISQNAFVNLGT